MQALFCVTTKGTRLWQPLGAWIRGAPSHQHWTYFFHPGTRSLIYSVEVSGMFCCFGQTRQSPQIFHSTSDIIFSRPSQMIPVTVSRVTAQFLELSACPITSHINGHTNQTSPIGIHTAPTISHHLQLLPPILRNAIGHCHFPLDTSDLVEEFNSETLVLASDGSVLMGAVIAINPNNAAAHYNLGLALRSLGQNTAAATEFATAQRLDPSIVPPPSPSPTR